MVELKLGGLGIKTSAHGCEQRGLVELVEFCIKEFGLDILAGPEWMFLPEKKVYNKEEKNNIIKKISQKTKGTNCLILSGTIVWQEDGLVSNTTPIIADGELIEEYSKWSDGGTDYIASCLQLKAKEHNKKGTCFKWRELGIGLEICSDHAFGSIKKNDAVERLDLQVILACGGILVNNHLKLKKGSYSFKCDGCYNDQPLLKKREEGVYMLIDPAETTLINQPYACKLYIYNLNFGGKTK